MIPRWRRDRTVFMGTGGPVEDATWLFRLRMAELKRVSAERVSDPQPLMRLLARLFDYGVWGVALLGVLGLVQMIAPAATGVVTTIAHPLVFPVVLTASWIPLEALLLANAQTTPGRWLLSVYLNCQVSNPYAPEEQRFTFDAAQRRARDVWWRGCGAGIPLLSMVTVARANEHVIRAGETPWDSKRDCLVTHGPVGTLSVVALCIGLIACTLAFASWWLEPVLTLARSTERAVTTASQRIGAARDAATAPPVPGPSSRVARVDDLAVPAPLRPSAAAAPPTGEAPSARSAGKPSVDSGAAAPESKGREPPAGTAASLVAPSSSPSSAPAPRRGSVPVPGTGGTAQETPAAIASAESTAPTSLELRDKRIARYVQQAKAEQARGDFAALARICQRWADEDWRDPRAFYCAGLGLQGIGRHKEAIAMFNQAGALVPRDDPLSILIGDAVLKSFRADSGR
jgi:hypothetical protein